MKVLVTGGAGFIGSHIVDRLILEGHEVVVVDNLSTGKVRNIHQSAKFYKCDILHSKLERIIKNERPEVINHHAAQMDVRRSVEDPLFDAQVNILGLIHLMQFAVKYGTRHVVFASSGGAVYGEQNQIPAVENQSTAPVSPYGISKLSGEKYLFYYKQNCGLDYTSLRYANVYGPRQDPYGEAGVVAIFTQKMLRNEQAILNGNGMQTRDYVYVDDVVEANMMAMHAKPVQTDTFNVGTGIETSVNQLYKLLQGLTECSLKEIHGPEKRGEQMRSCLDYSKIHKSLDWEPRIAIKTGLERTVNHFKTLLKK
ncbi:MAG: NAD-dependent epimerase/dehydratase family protein [Nitrospirae bacterium]|nr:NAD-dependent epimerase/dehydratase family protein [Nitrospirota bacterium]MBI3594825.1 NAD-dependent epimerase/dehydratase family protein [Nitrospirota bacterium]